MTIYFKDKNQPQKTPSHIEIKIKIRFHFQHSSHRNKGKVPKVNQNTKSYCVVPENIQTPLQRVFSSLTPHPTGFSIPEGILKIMCHYAFSSELCKLCTQSPIMRFHIDLHTIPEAQLIHWYSRYRIGIVDNVLSWDVWPTIIIIMTSFLIRFAISVIIIYR